MMPVVDKPVIQHVIEEAVAAGIKDIVLVTRSGKSSIEDHFDCHYELEAELERKGKQLFWNPSAISFQQTYQLQQSDNTKRLALATRFFAPHPSLVMRTSPCFCRIC